MNIIFICKEKQCPAVGI